MLPQLLWMDAVEARAQAVQSLLQGGDGDSRLPDADEAAREPGRELVAGQHLAAAAGSEEPQALTPLLTTRASAPVPVSGGPWDVLSVASSSAAARALRTVGSARMQLGSDAAVAGDEPVVDIRRFAQRLADLGHCTWVRSGLYNCPPESGMGTIRHKFVVVSVPGALQSRRRAACGVLGCAGVRRNVHHATRFILCAHPTPAGDAGSVYFVVDPNW